MDAEAPQLSATVSRSTPSTTPVVVLTTVQLLFVSALAALGRRIQYGAQFDRGEAVLAVTPRRCFVVLAAIKLRVTRLQ